MSTNRRLLGAETSSVDDDMEDRIGGCVDAKLRTRALGLLL